MLLAESLLGTSSTAANYIEDVFSTYLYTGSDSAQSISNGIDLATKGGMVWIKNRPNATDHYIVDSSRISGGDYGMLNSNSTAAQSFQAGVSSFDSGGFSLDGNVTQANRGGYGSYASWTFRKQAKFFDVVTYTGNGVAGRTVAHNLGSAPGCMIVKRTDGATNWRVYHRSLGATQYLDLDETVAAGTATTIWNDTAPTATVFSVGTNSGVNANGATYVAYLFAHDAGGFGASGADNVISCGSFNAVSAGSVSLGYEPQWLMFKAYDTASDWYILDNMRGFATGTSQNQRRLFANTSDAEANTSGLSPTATGFDYSALGANCIYIAIRRGPMKTPTSGTSVFTPVVYSGTGSSGLQVTTNIVTDMVIGQKLTGTEVYQHNWTDRLRGPLSMIRSPSSAAQLTTADWIQSFALMNGVTLYNDASVNESGTNNHVMYGFRRAPGFFDVVCYTGTGVNRTVSHNLGVAPELMIVKQRAGSGYGQWFVYNSASGNTKVLELQDATSGAYADSSAWNNTSPTSSVFTVGTSGATNYSGSTFVAYLFATVAGVSKVGSYTGSGTTKQIDCGFTNGARFVLIRRTDSGGDWYVWDTARGIVAGNDSYLLLNTTAGQVTNTDYIDTYSAGFEISSTAPAAINASGGTFIFLAIA